MEDNDIVRGMELLAINDLREPEFRSSSCGITAFWTPILCRNEASAAASCKSLLELLTSSCFNDASCCSTIRWVNFICPETL